MTLVCKNANWKIVDVATVVNVATDEERIIDSLVEMLKFGQDINAEFFVTFFKLMFGSDLEHRVWSRFWNWNLANILRLVLTWDLTIFGNTIGNKDRGEVIARTWFHSFFSRKKSEIWIAFTFFEKWKVKNKIPSLFFEKWKWNWNGSRSRTRSENEKKFSRILEKRESRWSLGSGQNFLTESTQDNPHWF